MVQKVSKSATSNDNKKSKSSKDKSKKKSHREKSPELPEEPLDAPIPSITDVFADHLIGKAKRSLEIETQNIPVKKKEENLARNSSPPARKEFDIPSITEIAKNVVINAKRKELEELEDIQKQINEAKRQLRSINTEESDDDDFLNLKADDNYMEDEDESLLSPVENQDAAKASQKRPSPIVYENDDNKSSLYPEPMSEEAVTSETPPRKTSVRERLGVKTTDEKKSDNIISLSAHRRMEREIYVPAFRRDFEKTSDSREQQRDRSRSRDRRAKSKEFRPNSREERPRDLRQESADRQKDWARENRRNSREDWGRDNRQKPREHQELWTRETRQSTKEHRETTRDRERRRERDQAARNGRRSVEKSASLPMSRRATLEREVELNEKPKRESVRQRIGSRVIVAPPKPHYDEEEIDVPVNSVVKIKPRPIVPINKQANKNLLLRAVAEAQKSIASSLSKQLEPPKLFSRPTESAKSRLGRRAKDLAKQKILIEVPQDKVHQIVVAADNDQESEDVAITVDNVVITEELTKEEENKPDETTPGPDTQFVVTLDGMYKKTEQRKNLVNEEKKIQMQVFTKSRLEATGKSSPVLAACKSPRKVPEKVSPKIQSRLDLKARPQTNNGSNLSPKKRTSPIRFEMPPARKPAEKRKTRDVSEPKRPRVEAKEVIIKLKRTESTESNDSEGKEVVEKKEPKKYDNIPSCEYFVFIIFYCKYCGILS